MKYISLFLLATLLAFSCGEATTAVEEAVAEAPEVTTPEPPAAPVAPSMLTATIDAVKSVGGDITALPAGAAVSNIDGWITKLKTMDGTDAIVGNLNDLKTELTSGDIDGSTVSGILSSLAEQTKGLADKAPALGTVASVLQAGADKLGGK